jgi:hypothetical protein
MRELRARLNLGSVYYLEHLTVQGEPSVYLGLQIDDSTRTIDVIEDTNNCLCSFQLGSTSCVE